MGMMRTRTTLARVYATAAHAAVGQRRKYTDQPYIVHPARVAVTVAKFGGTDEMIAAAYLHDVVEDTGVSIVDIQDMFGTDVALIVDGLTDVSKPEDGNRAVRKGIDATRLSLASKDAQIIKLADLIDNSDDIVANDPSFGKVFLKEKAHLLDVMDKVHAHALFAIATGAVNQG
mgnify:CR=1 FL=1